MACAQEHRNGKTLILWFWTVMCGGSGATHSLRVKPILEISLSATFDTSLRLFARTDCVAWIDFGATVIRPTRIE